MSAIGNIAVQDGESSPVTHTFYPIQSGPTSMWRENVTDLALVGQSTLKLVYTVDPRNGLHRQLWTLEIPALETAGDQNSAGYTAGPKVAYFSRAKLEIFHHNRSSMQFRKNQRVLLADILGDAIVADMNDNLNVPY